MSYSSISGVNQGQASLFAVARMRMAAMAQDTVRMSSDKVTPVDPSEAESARPYQDPVLLALSEQARSLMGMANSSGKSSAEPNKTGESGTAQNPATQMSYKNKTGQKPERTSSALTREEEDVVVDLAARDKEVKTNEQARVASSGGYAGTPRYDYQDGPDNRLYAVAGNVRIDDSPIQGDPEATLAKMRKINSAAMAVNSPSGADMGVAADSTQMEMKAMKEIKDDKANGMVKTPEATMRASTNSMTGGLSFIVEQAYRSSKTPQRQPLFRITA